MKKRTEYILIGYIIVTDWYGYRGWKKLEIHTDEKGLKEIEKEPLQDYISFGIKPNYAYFDVYKKEIQEYPDKIITIESKEPIKVIEAGKYTLTPKEEEAFMEDWDIAKIRY
jgi:hypothetical protein